MCVCVTLSVGVRLSADDWHQWRGIDRLGIWKETGVVDKLPDRLKLTWRVPINSGYSGPAVAAGRVFVTDWAEDPQSRTLDGTERILALDEETGEVLWLKDYVEDYGTSVPTWGITSAPLVENHLLIAIVGGERRALVVAFDKRTGAESWRAIDAGGALGYSQPIIYEAGGVRQLIVWYPAALVSLDPNTGDVYWNHAWDVGVGMSVATPVKSGDYLLVSQFIYGSMMMRLDRDRPRATMLWKGQGRSALPDRTDCMR